ncbi:WecB/TagA/CpsF family glycosyltransferase [Parasedimentitalea maritima]|nr:WecB/TagA/CpsF family glycosyltransferase [Zongyanglinia marina]
MQHRSSSLEKFFAQGAKPVFPKLDQCSVMNVDLVDATAGEVIDTLLQPGRNRVYFYNAHCANLRATDADYAQALTRADLILPDGIGIELAARMRGDALTSNLNGTDLLPSLLASAAKQNKSVFLLGGRPGTAQRAATHLQSLIPGLHIAGTRDGYGGAEDAEAAISVINASKADILLVAMGVPMQELWLDRHGHKLDADLMMAVGGLFDFWAGNVKRAPLWLRQLKSEWVWRLAMEPRRLAQRYLLGNFAFMWRAARHAVRSSSQYAIHKRVLDIVLSLGALTALSPLLLLICAAIRLESPGAVIFSQKRIGRNGKPFTLYKFRSMHVDAGARRQELLATSDREGICFKARNDPRVTRVGRFLRRFSLDELPQIVNILSGKMSIVGPRPALPEEVAAYSRRAHRRLSVKPGLTGIWQVSGRADIDFDRMVDMDIAYARSRSILLDLILIAVTFQAVFKGRGAY